MYTYNMYVRYYRTICRFIFFVLLRVQHVYMEGTIYIYGKIFKLCDTAQEWTNRTLAVHERSDSLLLSIAR